MPKSGNSHPLVLLDGRIDRDSMKIRLAEAADLAAVVTCEYLAFNLDTRVPGADNVSPHGELASQIKKGEIYVIATGSRFLGYISFARKHDHLFVTTIAVLPRYHRTGSGSRLLAHAEKAAVRLGLETVHLFTDGNNAGNLAFYLCHGYTETGRCQEGDFFRVYLSKSVARPDVRAMPGPTAGTNLTAA